MTTSICTQPRETAAESYISSVVAGEILVSTWVRKQCERHIADLESCTARGLYFDRDAAFRPIQWISRSCTITEDGISARTGQRLRLEPWQQAVLWILFGWRRVDGTRRFRNVYAELARGNGKSKLASAIALYILVGEGTKGAAVYSIATTLLQAKVVFDDSTLMAANSQVPELRALQSHQNNLHIPGTATVYRPLASDEHTLDALKPNLVVVDELHAHKSRGPWNKVKTAQGKKPGSMMLAITTAGYDRHSVCYEQRTYAEKVLEGIFDDDSYFAWICCLAPEDDPFDEANWPKANPNLGISIELQTLQDAAKQAQLIPSEYNEFLRMRCNIWTESSVQWMPMEKWDACSDPIATEELLGRPCFGGLDLATTTDIAAFVLLFPPHGKDAMWRILPTFFLPADNIAERVKRDRVPYDHWQRLNLFQLTPGNVIDYDYIRAAIQNLADQYDIREIAYDRWNAQQIVTQLEGDGMTMVPIGQGFASLNAPTKKLMELVLRQEIAHGANPVLRWMASNTVAETDATGSVKPSKKISTEKIDGIVATIIALARGMLAPPPKKKPMFFGLR